MEIVTKIAPICLALIMLGLGLGLSTKDFKKINIPTGIAMFPKEMSEWPPSSYIERIFNVQHLTKMNVGGHFPALEKPRLLTEDIRKFLNKIKL